MARTGEAAPDPPHGCGTVPRAPTPCAMPYTHLGYAFRSVSLLFPD